MTHPRRGGDRATTVVELEGATDEARYGGKATELGAALRADLPVPDGFAVPHDFLDELVEDRGPGSPPDDGESRSWSGDRDPGSPPGDRNPRSRVLDRVRGLEGPYVVRSSGVGEDGEAASFAGQHLTALNVVDAAGVVDALERVHASAHSAAVLEYRRQMGIEGPPRMGAVVQTMVDADASGVLFTRNPVDGSDERVVEAAPGLGEAVVEGMVTPDRFRLRPGGDVLERRPGRKDVRVVPAPDGGTRTETVPEPDRDRLCLDDEQLRRLDRLAERCEAYRSGGHDIEWAFAEGELHLLQRRDITTQS